MKRLLPPPASLFYALVSSLAVVAAGVLALPADTLAAASPCDDRAALQQRLDAFDARWNASDAWSLTAQFAEHGSLGAAGEPGRLAVYRELIARLGRLPAPRQTRLLRATDVGGSCLVDVQVQTAERREAGLFLLAPTAEGGIVAMR